MHEFDAWSRTGVLINVIIVRTELWLMLQCVMYHALRHGQFYVQCVTHSARSRTDTVTVVKS